MQELTESSRPNGLPTNARAPCAVVHSHAAPQVLPWRTSSAELAECDSLWNLACTQEGSICNDASMSTVDMPFRSVMWHKQEGR